jgi:hypothetical protein
MEWSSFPQNDNTMENKFTVLVQCLCISIKKCSSCRVVVNGNRLPLNPFSKLQKALLHKQSVLCAYSSSFRINFRILCSVCFLEDNLIKPTLHISTHMFMNCVFSHSHIFTVQIQPITSKLCDSISLINNQHTLFHCVELYNYLSLSSILNFEITSIHTLFISTHQYQHQFIDLNISTVLQRQFIQYQTHSESTLQWSMFIVNNISQHIHISTLIALWMNTHLNITHNQIMKWFQTQDTITQLYLKWLKLHSQSIASVVSWFISINWFINSETIQSQSQTTWVTVKFQIIGFWLLFFNTIIHNTTTIDWYKKHLKQYY